jgi:XTP/dITP diphosphohydrolase
MDVEFLTSNAGKVREAQGILAPYGIRVRPVRRSLPEPQADDLETVVRAKLAAVPPSDRPQLVEDSGLFVPALIGFPGVYTAYIYRIWKFDLLLELLERRPRTALFRTVAGLRQGRTERLFLGECRGSLARAARGEHGFGFDPIFVPEGSRRTFAEMEEEAKWTVSHRGRALRAVGEYLTRSAARSKK